VVLVVALCRTLARVADCLRPSRTTCEPNPTPTREVEAEAEEVEAEAEEVEVEEAGAEVEEEEEEEEAEEEEDDECGVNDAEFDSCSAILTLSPFDFFGPWHVFV
jgi:hypothetical protein